MESEPGEATWIVDIPGLTRVDAGWLFGQLRQWPDDVDPVAINPAVTFAVLADHAHAQYDLRVLDAAQRHRWGRGTRRWLEVSRDWTAEWLAGAGLPATGQVGHAKVGIGYWSVHPTERFGRAEAERVVQLVADRGYEARALSLQEWMWAADDRCGVRRRVRVLSAALRGKWVSGDDLARARTDLRACRAWLRRTRGFEVRWQVALRLERLFPDWWRAVEASTRAPGDNPREEDPAFHVGDDPWDWRVPAWSVEVTGLNRSDANRLVAELTPGQVAPPFEPFVSDPRERLVWYADPERAAYEFRVANAALTRRYLGLKTRTIARMAARSASEWLAVMAEPAAALSGDGEPGRIVIELWSVNIPGLSRPDAEAIAARWESRGRATHVLEPHAWMRVDIPASEVRHRLRITREALHSGLLSEADARVARGDVHAYRVWLSRRSSDTRLRPRPRLSRR